MMSFSLIYKVPDQPWTKPNLGLLTKFLVHCMCIADSHVNHVENNPFVPLESYPKRIVVGEDLIKPVHASHVLVVVNYSIRLLDDLSTAVALSQRDDLASVPRGQCQDVSIISPLEANYVALSFADYSSFV